MAPVEDKPFEPLRLTREELLTIENKHLKMENMKLQIERLAAEAGLLEREIDTYRVSLEKKYSVPIERNSVRPDGTILKPA